MHYVIIGREIGDDEDTCLITDAIDEVSAVAEFKEMMCGPHRQEKDVEVLFNHVLSSSSPIETLYVRT